MALAVALGVALVNPATGEGRTASLTAAAEDSAVGTGANQAALQQARAQVAQVADAVAARAVAVRADGAQAQVPPEQLSQLDALRAEVGTLVSQVQAAPARTDRAGVTSRGGSSAERSPGTQPSASAPAATASAATAAAPPAPGASGAASATTTAGAPSPGATASTSAGSPSPAASSSPTDTSAAGTATAQAGPGTASPSTVAASAAPAPTPSSGTAAPSVDTPDQVIAAIPPVLATDDPDAARLRDAVIALARSTAAVSASADANRAAAKAAADAATQAAADAAAQQAAAAAQAAAAQAAAAAQQAAWKASLQGFPNGRIPASALCAPSFAPGALLRCDAAQDLDRMDAAFFAAFGAHLTVQDSYRSYASQVACISTRGSLCATPGTSHHGLGVAVDLGGGVEQAFSAQHLWLVRNAATFGWMHPAWAEPGGSKPEPWHWEYTG